MTGSELFIYIIIAGFFAYRLWSVLGRTNGTEKKRAIETAEFAEKIRAEAAGKKAAMAIVTDTKQAEIKQEEIPPHLADDVAKAKKIDPAFTLSKFMEGATGAFEMVVKAFSEGRKEALKFLLSPDVYKSFEQEIDERTKKELTANHSVYSMQTPEVLDVEIKENICQIVVKYVSEQFNYVKNKAGDIIEGSKNQLDHVSDIWTFERDLTSKKPNWVVVGIQSA